METTGSEKKRQLRKQEIRINYFQDEIIRYLLGRVKELEAELSFLNGEAGIKNKGFLKVAYRG